MNAAPWLHFKPMLTWDGLLTFLGGMLAFFAILIQVHFANKGLETQLQEEKGVRARERHRRNRATATAILFEIDDFYRYFILEPRKALPAAKNARPYHPQLGQCP